MSIKDLFGKKSLNVSSAPKNAEDYKEVESIQYVEEYNKTSAKFIVPVDFEDPSQFARYGMAKRYYTEAIEYITKTYPYDGSLYEKQKWHNDSSDLVNYFFDNKYPRNNGYVKIGQNYGTSSTSDQNYYSSSVNEYIHFKGTYNTGNKHQPEKNREYSLKIDGDEGNTVEFYFKRDNLSGSHKQVILDIWNSQASSSSDYGRMMIEVHPGISGEEDKIYLQISSGSSGYTGFELGDNLDFTGSWHHYAVSYQNSGSTIKAQLLVDGDVVDTQTGGTTIGRIYGAMQGQIGSLITAASGTLSERGWGKLSGSLDEFRFWKKKRTDKEVALNYFTTIGGGTNTDDSNTSLGIYYKFNEGIYNANIISSFDKIILDYSGRTSNGSWEGYSLGSREVDSALVLSGKATKEFKDPIVYSKHEDIIALLQQYETLGEEYDSTNNSSLYRTLPSWKIDEDQENGKGTEVLLQIVSEFFDSLHNKISFLPQLKEVYYSDKDAPPFMWNLLQNYGVDVIDIFNDAESLELFLSKNEKENYEEKIYKVKNFIYQNLYNNISNINKEKGTIKSFRNILHCFGINEDILRLQIYPNNTETTVKERFTTRATKKETAVFNHQDSNEAVIFQELNSNFSESQGFIPQTSDIKSLGTTFEVELFFPKKIKINQDGFYSTTFFSSSLFGMHETDGVGNFASTDRADIQVFAIRKELESPDVYFKLSSSYFDINEDSEIFPEVYDNNKWNFALRIKPEKYPMSDHVSGSVIENYIVELYGVSYEQDIQEEVLLLSKSIDSTKGDAFYSAKKGIYIGAHKTNYTGSVISVDSNTINLQKADTEFVSARYWHSYLDNEDIILHAKDSTNYGANSESFKIACQQFILENPSYFGGDFSQNKTLALHWNYLDLQAESQEFYLQDSSFSSLKIEDSDFASRFTNKNFTGTGKSFRDGKISNTRFLNSVVQQNNVDAVSTDDLIDILDEYDDLFERETKIVDYYFILEKGMHSIISKEMISWLGTIKQYNNIIGEPVNRYKQKYDKLDLLRTMFFKNVKNQPDYNKFKEFYRWIDDSISLIIEQLMPISTNYSSGIVNIIESHALERNKYAHKLPTIEFVGDPDIPSVKGINELLYNWKIGHAPLSGLERNNCLWWADRAERSGMLNSDRQEIFEVIKQTRDRKFGAPYSLNLDGRLSIAKKTKPDLEGTILVKKRQHDIIINEVGFDLSGVNYTEISDIIPAFSDCEDEE